MTGLHARKNLSLDVKKGSVHTSKWYAKRKIKEFNPKKQIQIEHDHKLSIDTDILAEYQRLTKTIPTDVIEAELIE